MFLVDTPSVVDMWAWCTSQLRVPSLRLIDFTECIYIPFNPGDPWPGTPLSLAAPELLRSFNSEMTTGIDIWAFASTSWELLGEDSLFNTVYNAIAEILANIIFFSARKRERISQSDCGTSSGRNFEGNSGSNIMGGQ